MMTKWRRANTSAALEAMMPGVRIFQRVVDDGFLEVFITIDDGLWHMSICHKLVANNAPGRYPSWDEIYDARYLFCPKDKTMVMMLPPMDEYVNHHETTFHLWELHATPLGIGGM